MQEPYEDDYRAAEIADIVRGELTAMTIDELRAFAQNNKIDISGLKAKADIVDAMAIYPGIATLLGLDAGDTDEEVPAPPTPEEEVEETTPEEPEEPEEPSHVALNERLRESLRTRVDFSVLDSFLSETVSKFKERSFDASLQTARDSIYKVDEKVRDYVESCWAFAIASAQKILETSNKSSRAAKEAKSRLQEAADAFQGGSFFKASELLDGLVIAAVELFNYEMEKARDRVASQEKALQNIQAMGGDVSAALTMLRRASEALNENDRASYLDLIGESDALVEKARAGRIEEIKDALDSVEAMIHETEAIGADVSGARDLLEKVKDAVRSDDFIAANDLVSEAEQMVLEIQKSHIDRVSQMKEKQIQKVKELIAHIKPLIDEARSEGFQANEAMQDLKAAAAAVNSGDYVNALLMAKKSYGAVKSFTSQAEAASLENVPVGLEEVEELDALAPEEDVERQLEVTCANCGSSNIEIGSRGKSKCLDCGKKFKVRA